MRERGWRKVHLARALGLNPRQIDRLLNFNRATTVAQLEQALKVCGRVVAVEARELEIAADKPARRRSARSGIIHRARHSTGRPSDACSGSRKTSG
jgi:hypothetical protein